MKQKLQSWQPIKDVGEVFQSSISYQPKKGLHLKIEDTSGYHIDVMYDRISAIQDYIWTYRFTKTCDRKDILDLADVAEQSKQTSDQANHIFYKMHQSNFLAWYDSLPWLGSKDIPGVEHHLYICGEYIYEVISDYEPLFHASRTNED